MLTKIPAWNAIVWCSIQRCLNIRLVCTKVWHNTYQEISYRDIHIYPIPYAIWCAVIKLGHRYIPCVKKIYICFIDIFPPINCRLKFTNNVLFLSRFSYLIVQIHESRWSSLMKSVTEPTFAIALWQFCTIWNIKKFLVFLTWLLWKKYI